MKSLELSIKFEVKITELMKNKYSEMIKGDHLSSCDLQALPKFTGSISNSFEPYLAPYIKSEEEALCEGLNKSL